MGQVDDSSNAQERREAVIGRRGLLAGAGAAAVLTATARTGTAAAPPERRTRGDLTLREGTDFAAVVSPDGKHIAIDTLGVLWILPRSGGPARRITSDLYDITQPQWAPDSRRLVFQSYRDGVFNLWVVGLDGGGLRQLTTGPYDHREPRWSPDGRRIVYSSDASGRYDIYELDTRTGDIATVVSSDEETYEPAYSPDGERIAYVVGDTRVDVIDRRSGEQTTEISVEEPDVIHQPSWTPDGKQVSYHLLSGDTSRLMLGDKALTGDEQAFPFQASWLSADEFLYAADGEIRTRRLGGETSETVGFSIAVPVKRPRYRRRRRDFESRRPHPVVGIGSPMLSPSGDRIAFRALNDLWVLRIGERLEPLTGDRWWKCDPAWSPDGTRLAYSTDRAGTLDLWIRDLESGDDQSTDRPRRPRGARGGVVTGR